MPDINALLNDYFVNVGDVVGAGKSPSDADVAITAETRPRTASGCNAIHLIDGVNYFGAIKAEVAALLAGGTDRFFYTCSWWLGTSKSPASANIEGGGGKIGVSAWSHPSDVGLPPFELHDNGAGPFHPFREDIAQMAAAGVDVRVFAWASPFLVNFEAAAAKVGDFQYWAVNVNTLQSVLDLRALPGMSGKVVLDILGHTLGAMHLKTVVCGDSSGFRAYASGIDFVQNRNAKPGHSAGDTWHDVGIRIEGSGADAMFTSFSTLWNEQLSRSPKKFKAFGFEIPSHTDDAEMIDPRDTAPLTGGQHVQVLRTLPTMNFSTFATDRIDVGCLKRLVSGFKQKKLSFAPDGVFEFRAAQRKAIGAAKSYIYIEDQALWNFEIADWINARLKAVPALKAIFLQAGDPLDPPSPFLASFVHRVVDGLASPADRVACALATYTVHAKLTVIDDNWASIGSSNCMRRSFYTDGEVSISVVDENEPSFAAKLRRDLWADHCQKPLGTVSDSLLTLNDALGLWNPAWGSPPSGFALSPEITLMKVPLVFNTPASPGEFPGPEPSPSEQERDQQDADSRLEY